MKYFRSVSWGMWFLGKTKYVELFALLCKSPTTFSHKFGYQNENFINTYNGNDFVLYENRFFNIHSDSPACSEDMAKGSEILAFWWGFILGYCIK